MATIGEFRAAHGEFLDALASVPDDALSYLRPGEDYALGGIVLHVDEVLARYGDLLTALIAAGFTAIDAPDDPERARALEGRVGAGLTAGERTDAMAALQSHHDAFAALMASLPADQQVIQAPVRFGEAEPYPTSAADIAGWLVDHYREHVPQIRELSAEWAARGTAPLDSGVGAGSE